VTGLKIVIALICVWDAMTVQRVCIEMRVEKGKCNDSKSLKKIVVGQYDQWTVICPAPIGASALKAAGDKSRPYGVHP